METLLKRKGLWNFKKTAITNPTDVDAKFVINVKNDEIVGVNTTYISREIHFHTSGLDCPHSI